MKTRSSKIAFVFALYLAGHFFDACSYTNKDCSCPEIEFPYFDYKKIVLETTDPKPNEDFVIEITPDSIQLLAQATPGFHFMSAAYGCDCKIDGDNGDKYSPTAMDVFADRDFNDTLPAGTSLRSIFQGQTLGDIVTTLSSDFRPEKFNFKDNSYFIRTSQRPKHLGEPYHFQILWTKSNGDTLVAQTEAVIFN